jgi:hypothetical protein
MDINKFNEAQTLLAKLNAVKELQEGLKMQDFRDVMYKRIPGLSLLIGEIVRKVDDMRSDISRDFDAL